MKKVLFGLALIVLCITLVGCGPRGQKVEKLLDKALDQADKMLDEAERELDEEVEEKNLPEEDIELYSDDNKIVFKQSDTYTIVFYYEGEKITGHEVYLDYNTSTAANLAYKAYKAQPEENVIDFYVKGKYLVIKYGEEEYSNYTVDSVKLLYSYLEEVQKES